MQAAGRRRGITRGTAGTIPSITIPGGIGTIRSTIPRGIMVGIIRTIILHGIRPAIIAIVPRLVEAIA